MNDYLLQAQYKNVRSNRPCLDKDREVEKLITVLKLELLFSWNDANLIIK